MCIKLTFTTWISGSLHKDQQRANSENNRKSNEKKLDFTWCRVSLNDREGEGSLTMFVYILTSSGLIHLFIDI